MPADPPPQTVAFVGLGALGEPASRALHRAGFRLALFDRDAARVARLAAEYGVATDTPVAQCALVVTALPDGDAVRAFALGAPLARGALLVDMGSCDPEGTRALGALLAARGVAMVDAPVSGGVRGAREANLVFMVGGAPADRARARPLLQAMGRQVFELGPLGAGHALKCLNNYVAAAGYAAACEALLAGRRYGLEPQAMLDAINASSGRSYNTEGKFAQHVLTRTWGSGFSLGMMAKDLRIMRALAAHTQVPFTLGEACLSLWESAERAVGADADHTEYVRPLEAAAGVRLAPDRPPGD